MNSNQNPQRRSWGLPLIIVMVLVVGVAGFGYLLGARLTATRVLPTPNGYDDFIAAQKLIPQQSPDWQALSREDLRAVVISNAPALALVRAGLAKACLVRPLGSMSNLNVHMEQLGGFKQVARAFAAETHFASLEGRTNDTLMAMLDCIRFGQECARGGPIIDCLVGIAVQSIGLMQLDQSLQALDVEGLKSAALKLEEILNTHETAADVEINEALWVRQNFKASQRIPLQFIALFRPSPTRAPLAKIDPHYQHLARTMVQCATLAFEKETGKPPATVANLVPQYLKKVPTLTVQK